MSNGPLNRRRTAILRQQRSVQVEVPQRGQINHPLWYDAPISDDNNCVRRDSRKLPAKFLVVLDLVRLADLQSQLQCSQLYRRERKLHTSALGPVWLRHHDRHRKPGFHQLLESWHGEGGRAAENEIERRKHWTSDVGPQTPAAIPVRTACADVRGPTPGAALPTTRPLSSACGSCVS